MSKQFHSLREDIFAMVCSATFMAFGILLYKSAGLLTGGTAGLALLFTHLTQFSFGQIFFTLNIPFYILAFKQMGIRFCVNTFIAVTLVSVMADLAPMVVSFNNLEPAFAAVFGGFLFGTGMLMLFRHQTSLGGVGILALYLQSKNIISAGRFQMMVDCAIVAASFFIVSMPILIMSIAGAIAMNLIIAMNHKPGRYQIT